MTPERWVQIEELFHRTIECDPRQRASLLDEACHGDSEMRREVEALLASEETASDHMQAAVRCGLDAVTFPLVGEIVSHYRILDGLGGGGMGSVYRAEDIKLGRQVALKFLPEESTKNPAALRRFEREARSASALEHPNICPIYEFGEHEGQPFLAMQLLKGQTLREAISTPDRGRAPLRVDKLLDLAIQIVNGLETAHSQGIIHRDIKPANIFVTTQGQAIILDFGLAKLFHREAIEDEVERTPQEWGTGKRQASSKVIRAARDPLVSLTGATIGTAGYMSPEQVRGEILDARTDLFSFGAVLFEMATGQMAFFGNTAAMVHESITEGTPTPLTRVNPEMPAELERIVSKALEKEPKLRYQSAAEIRTDLQRLNGDSDLERAPANIHAAVYRSNRYVVPAVCFGLLAAIVTTYHSWHHPRSPDVPAKITRISQWNKPMSGHARLSPDGHSVVFASLVGGIFQLFVTLTSGGEPLQLTTDGGDKYPERFSTDGTEIYYQRTSDDVEVWTVPTLGGSPRRIATGYAPVPSSDGAFIFYCKLDSPGILLADKSGLNEAMVYKSEDAGLSLRPLLEFPGGNDLLVAGSKENQIDLHFFRINLTRHEAVDLGEVASGNGDVAWAEPGNSLLLGRTVNGLTNIWKYDLRNRGLTQITFGPGGDYSPMPDPGGKGIYFVNAKFSVVLTAYSFQSRESREIASDYYAFQPIISADGKRVMYITAPTEQRTELWVSDIDGKHKLKIAGGEDLATGTWAPNSTWLSYFDMQSSVGAKAYIVRADGNGLRQIPEIGHSLTLNPVWSPNQKSVYLSTIENWEEASPKIWKWSLDSSKPQEIVDKCGIVYDVDPGEQYLLGAWPAAVGSAGIYEVSISDRKCVPLIPGVKTDRPMFSRDGKSILYEAVSGGATVIFRQGWKDGKLIGTPQVALKVPFPFPLSFNDYDFSRDLSTIVYARPGGNADLYLLSQK